MASNLHYLPNPSNLSILPSKTGRRRARYGKPTNSIRSKQAKPYEDALDYATANEQRLGLTFVFLTVWWGGTTYAGAPDYSPLVIEKLEAFRKWFLRHGEPFYAFWVREIGETKGEHWHLLVHCPEYLRQGPDGFHTYVRRIIPKRQTGAVKIESRKYHQPCEGCGHRRDWHHLARCYFLKGSTDPVRERSGITKCASALPTVYAQNQGIIRGKRLGYSCPFGATARQRASSASDSIVPLPDARY